ncbi:hypothetical protein D0C16_13050 [Cellvibrio sp. KY-GH-1]|nr:hypothetical protein D0C16_13050 [Cellvibrio sp. KY-GH-1]
MIDKNRFLMASKKTIFIIIGILLGYLSALYLYGNFELSITGVFVVCSGVVIYFFSNYFNKK